MPRNFSGWRVCGRAVLLAAAAAFVLQIVFALAGLPAAFVHWLTAREYRSSTVPDYLVVLGGGGIPSESGLIRTYYAASFGAARTGIVYVVSLPADDDPEQSSVGRMRDELVLRGVRKKDVIMEYRARNTHEQAVQIARLLGPEALGGRVMIVTSPSHLRRAVRCFEREGFRNLSAMGAVGTGAEADVGPGAAFRYVFWQRWEFQIEALRELTALAYYRLRGWI